MIRYWTDKKNKIFLRATAVTVSAALLFTLVAAPYAEASFWAERKRSVQDMDGRQTRGLEALSGETPALDGNDMPLPEMEAKPPFDLPETIGRVVEVYRGDPLEGSPADRSRPLVIHIQDAHGYVQAQKNLAAILRSIRRQAPLMTSSSGTDRDPKPLLVCAEGAWKKVETEWMHVFPDKKILEEGARELIESSRVTGEEYLGILEGGRAVQIYGIEDRALYAANVKARERVEKMAGRVLQSGAKDAIRIKVVGDLIHSLKSEIYPDRLRELDRLRFRYGKGKAGLEDYLALLRSSVSRRQWEETASPDLRSFCESVDLGKSIHRGSLVLERDGFIKKLQTLLDPEALKAFVEASLQFRLGKMDARRYYGRLLGLAQIHGVRLTEMEKYVLYLEQSGRIRMDLVGDDLDAASWKIEEILCAGHPLAERLLAADRWVELEGKLWSLEMRPAEWKRSVELRMETGWDDVRLLLGEACAKGFIRSFDFNSPQNLRAWTRFIELLEKGRKDADDYYRFAAQRNQVFIDKTLEAASLLGADRVVLVAGGFHTSGISEILREKSVPYVVVRPDLGDRNMVKRDSTHPEAGEESSTLRDESSYMRSAVWLEFTESLLARAAQGLGPDAFARLFEANVQALRDFAATVADSEVLRMAEELIDNVGRLYAAPSFKDVEGTEYTLFAARRPTSTRYTMFVRKNGQLKVYYDRGILEDAELNLAAKEFVVDKDWGLRSLKNGKDLWALGGLMKADLRPAADGQKSVLKLKPVQFNLPTLTPKRKDQGPQDRRPSKPKLETRPLTPSLLANLFSGKLGWNGRLEWANWVVRIVFIGAVLPHEFGHYIEGVVSRRPEVRDVRWNHFLSGMPWETRGPPALMGLMFNLLIFIPLRFCFADSTNILLVYLIWANSRLILSEVLLTPFAAFIGISKHADILQIADSTKEYISIQSIVDSAADKVFDSYAAEDESTAAQDDILLVPQNILQEKIWQEMDRRTGEALATREIIKSVVRNKISEELAKRESVAQAFLGEARRIHELYDEQGESNPILYRQIAELYECARYTYEVMGISAGYPSDLTAKQSNVHIELEKFYGNAYDNDERPDFIISIVTSNRSEQLDILLRSIENHLTLFPYGLRSNTDGPKIKMIVVDNSTDPANVDRNRKIAKEFSDRSRIPVTLVDISGPDFQHNYAYPLNVAAAASDSLQEINALQWLIDDDMRMETLVPLSDGTLGLRHAFPYFDKIQKLMKNPDVDEIEVGATGATGNTPFRTMLNSAIDLLGALRFFAQHEPSEDYDPEIDFRSITIDNFYAPDYEFNRSQDEGKYSRRLRVRGEKESRFTGDQFKIYCSLLETLKYGNRLGKVIIYDPMTSKVDRVKAPYLPLVLFDPVGGCSVKRYGSSTHPFFTPPYMRRVHQARSAIINKYHKEKVYFSPIPLHHVRPPFSDEIDDKAFMSLAKKGVMSKVMMTALRYLIERVPPSGDKADYKSVMDALRRYLKENYAAGNDGLRDELKNLENEVWDDYVRQMLETIRDVVRAIHEEGYLTDEKYFWVRLPEYRESLEELKELVHYLETYFLPDSRFIADFERTFQVGQGRMMDEIVGDILGADIENISAEAGRALSRKENVVQAAFTQVEFAPYGTAKTRVLHGYTTPGGYYADEVVSGLQKEIRRGNPDAAYWAFELARTSETMEKKLWQRLLFISVEDVGPADPQAVEVLWELHQRYWAQAPESVERESLLLNAVNFLVSSKKDRFNDETYILNKLEHPEAEGFYTRGDFAAALKERNHEAAMKIGMGMIRSGKEAGVIQGLTDQFLRDGRMGGYLGGTLEEIAGLISSEDRNLFLIHGIGILCHSDENAGGGTDAKSVVDSMMANTLSRDELVFLSGKRLPIQDYYLDDHTVRGKILGRDFAYFINTSSLLANQWEERDRTPRQRILNILGLKGPMADDMGWRSGIAIPASAPTTFKFDQKYAIQDVGEVIRIAGQYDVGDVFPESIVNLKDSRNNQSISFRTTKGQYILRKCVMSNTMEKMDYDTALMGHLKAKGVPVPDVIPTRQGELFTGNNGEFVYVMKYINNKQFDWKDFSPAKLRSAAQMLARFHRAVVDFFPRHEKAARSVFNLEKVAGKIEATVQSLQGKKSEWSKAEAFLMQTHPFIRAQMDVVRAYVQKGETSLLPELHIHGDYIPWNILFDPIHQDAVAGVIDVDFSRKEVRVWDFVNGIIPGFPFFRGLWKKTDPACDIENLKIFVKAYQEEARKLGNPLSPEEIRAIPIVLKIKLLDVYHWLSDPKELNEVANDQEKLEFYHYLVSMMEYFDQQDWEGFARDVEEDFAAADTVGENAVTTLSAADALFNNINGFKLAVDGQNLIFSKSRTGEVSLYHEVAGALEPLDVSEYKNVVKDILDIDHDGKITFMEFVSMLMPSAPDAGESTFEINLHLSSMFNGIDADVDGAVDGMEVRQMSPRQIGDILLLFMKALEIPTPTHVRWDFVEDKVDVNLHFNDPDYRDRENGLTPSLLANLFSGKPGWNGRLEWLNWVVRIVFIGAVLPHEFGHYIEGVVSRRPEVRGVRWNHFLSGMPWETRGPPALAGLAVNLLIFLPLSFYFANSTNVVLSYLIWSNFGLVLSEVVLTPLAGSLGVSEHADLRQLMSPKKNLLEIEISDKASLLAFEELAGVYKKFGDYLDAHYSYAAERGKKKIIAGPKLEKRKSEIGELILNGDLYSDGVAVLDELVSDMTGDVSPYRRANTVKLLSMILSENWVKRREHDRIVNQIIGALQDEERIVRIEAIQALGEAGVAHKLSQWQFKKILANLDESAIDYATGQALADCIKVLAPIVAGMDVDNGKPDVLVYPGTFDPPHNGHESCIEQALNVAPGHQAWVYLNFNPTHKKDALRLKHRMNMMRKMIASMPDAYIIPESVMPPNKEKWIGGKNYYLESIEKYARKIGLIRGSDVLVRKDYGDGARIDVRTPLSKYFHVILNRPGENNADNLTMARLFEDARDLGWMVIDTKSDVSSTGIRELFYGKTDKRVKSDIHPYIYRYILSNNLYQSRKRFLSAGKNEVYRALELALLALLVIAAFCTPAVLIVYFIVLISSVMIYQVVSIALYSNLKPLPQKPVPELKSDEWPTLVVQLPICNEPQVAERVIRSAVNMEYPGPVQYQILDDSTEPALTYLKPLLDELHGIGHNVTYLRRESRFGFKAGNLAFGLNHSEAEFCVIFDSDFIPPKDYLKKTVPFLVKDDSLAAIQTPWGHINRDENLLTQIQSERLDHYHMVEQISLTDKGISAEFNGSAVVWRRKAIDSAGGWQGDTATENFDLWFRVLRMGGKVGAIQTPFAEGELPSSMIELIKQRGRWDRGVSENLKKYIKALYMNTTLSLKEKYYVLYRFSKPLSSMFLSSLVIIIMPLVVKYSALYGWEVPLEAMSVLYLALLGVSAVVDWASLDKVRENPGLGAPRLMLIRIAALFLNRGLTFAKTVSALEGLIFKETKYEGSKKKGSENAARPTAFNRSQIRLYIIAVVTLAFGLYSLIAGISALSMGLMGAATYELLYAVSLTWVGASAFLELIYPVKNPVLLLGSLVKNKWGSGKGASSSKEMYELGKRRLEDKFKHTDIGKLIKDIGLRRDYHSVKSLTEYIVEVINVKGRMGLISDSQMREYEESLYENLLSVEGDDAKYHVAEAIAAIGVAHGESDIMDFLKRLENKFYLRDPMVSRYYPVILGRFMNASGYSDETKLKLIQEVYEFIGRGITKDANVIYLFDSLGWTYHLFNVRQREKLKQIIAMSIVKHHPIQRLALYRHMIRIDNKWPQIDVEAADPLEQSYLTKFNQGRFGQNVPSLEAYVKLVQEKASLLRSGGMFYNAEPHLALAYEPSIAYAIRDSLEIVMQDTKDKSNREHWVNQLADSLNDILEMHPDERVKYAAAEALEKLAPHMNVSQRKNELGHLIRVLKGDDEQSSRFTPNPIGEYMAGLSNADRIKVMDELWESRLQLDPSRRRYIFRVLFEELIRCEQSDDETAVTIERALQMMQDQSEIVRAVSYRLGVVLSRVPIAKRKLVADLLTPNYLNSIIVSDLKRPVVSAGIHESITAIYKYLDKEETRERQEMEWRAEAKEQTAKRIDLLMKKHPDIVREHLFRLTNKKIGEFTIQVRHEINAVNRAIIMLEGNALVFVIDTGSSLTLESQFIKALENVEFPRDHERERKLAKREQKVRAEIADLERRKKMALIIRNSGAILDSLQRLSVLYQELREVMKERYLWVQEGRCDLRIYSNVDDSPPEDTAGMCLRQSVRMGVRTVGSKALDTVIAPGIFLNAAESLLQEGLIVDVVPGTVELNLQLTDNLPERSAVISIGITHVNLASSKIKSIISLAREKRVSNLRDALAQVQSINSPDELMGMLNIDIEQQSEHYERMYESIIMPINQALKENENLKEYLIGLSAKYGLVAALERVGFIGAKDLPFIISVMGAIEKRRNQTPLSDAVETLQAIKEADPYCTVSIQNLWELGGEEDVRKCIKQLSDLGLVDSVETQYGGYSMEQRSLAGKLADDYGLHKTGGSGARRLKPDADYPVRIGFGRDGNVSVSWDMVRGPAEKASDPRFNEGLILLDRYKEAVRGGDKSASTSLFSEARDKLMESLYMDKYQYKAYDALSDLYRTAAEAERVNAKIDPEKADQRVLERQDAPLNTGSRFDSRKTYSVVKNIAMALSDMGDQSEEPSSPAALEKLRTVQVKDIVDGDYQEIIPLLRKAMNYLGTHDVGNIMGAKANVNARDLFIQKLEWMDEADADSFQSWLEDLIYAYSLALHNDPDAPYLSDINNNFPIHEIVQAVMQSPGHPGVNEQIMANNITNELGKQRSEVSGRFRLGEYILIYGVPVRFDHITGNYIVDKNMWFKEFSENVVTVAKEDGSPLPPKVTVVVLDYKDNENTMQLVRSLSQSAYPYFDVIVLSQDKSRFHQRFSPDLLDLGNIRQLTILRTPENLGCARGRNLVNKYAFKGGMDYLLQLDDDTQISPDMTDKLVEFAEKSDKSIGAVGPLFYRLEKGKRIEKIWKVEGYIHGKKRQLLWDDIREKPREVDLVPGAGILFRRDALRMVGSYDAGYFGQLEDTDFFARYRDLGYQSYFLPNAIMWHERSTVFDPRKQSAGQPDFFYLFIRNFFRMARKGLKFFSDEGIYQTMFRFIFRENVKFKSFAMTKKTVRGMVHGLFGYYEMMRYRTVYEPAVSVFVSDPYARHRRDVTVGSSTVDHLYISEPLVIKPAKQVSKMINEAPRGQVLAVVGEPGSLKRDICHSLAVQNQESSIMITSLFSLSDGMNQMLKGDAEIIFINGIKYINRDILRQFVAHASALGKKVVLISGTGRNESYEQHLSSLKEFDVRQAVYVPSKIESDEEKEFFSRLRHDFEFSELLSDRGVDDQNYKSAITEFRELAAGQSDVYEILIQSIKLGRKGKESVLDILFPKVPFISALEMRVALDEVLENSAYVHKNQVPNLNQIKSIINKANDLYRHKYNKDAPDFDLILFGTYSDGRADLYSDMDWVLVPSSGHNYGENGYDRAGLLAFKELLELAFGSKMEHVAVILPDYSDIAPYFTRYYWHSTIRVFRGKAMVSQNIWDIIGTQDKKTSVDALGNDELARAASEKWLQEAVIGLSEKLHARWNFIPKVDERGYRLLFQWLEYIVVFAVAALGLSLLGVDLQALWTNLSLQRSFYAVSLGLLFPAGHYLFAGTALETSRENQTMAWILAFANLSLLLIPAPMSLIVTLAFVNHFLLNLASEILSGINVEIQTAEGVSSAVLSFSSPLLAPLRPFAQKIAESGWARMTAQDQTNRFLPAFIRKIEQTLSRDARIRAGAVRDKGISELVSSLPGIQLFFGGAPAVAAAGDGVSVRPSMAMGGALALEPSLPRFLFQSELLSQINDANWVLRFSLLGMISLGPRYWLHSVLDAVTNAVSGWIDALAGMLSRRGPSLQKLKAEEEASTPLKREEVVQRVRETVDAFFSRFDEYVDKEAATQIFHIGGREFVASIDETGFSLTEACLEWNRRLASKIRESGTDAANQKKMIITFDSRELGPGQGPQITDQIVQALGVEDLIASGHVIFRNLAEPGASAESIAKDAKENSPGSVMVVCADRQAGLWEDLSGDIPRVTIAKNILDRGMQVNLAGAAARWLKDSMPDQFGSVKDDKIALDSRSVGAEPLEEMWQTAGVGANVNAAIGPAAASNRFIDGIRSWKGLPRARMAVLAAWLASFWNYGTVHAGSASGSLASQTPFTAPDLGQAAIPWLFGAGGLALTYWLAPKLNKVFHAKVSPAVRFVLVPIGFLLLEKILSIEHVPVLTQLVSPILKMAWLTQSSLAPGLMLVLPAVLYLTIVGVRERIFKAKHKLSHIGTLAASILAVVPLLTGGTGIEAIAVSWGIFGGRILAYFFFSYTHPTSKDGAKLYIFAFFEELSFRAIVLPLHINMFVGIFIDMGIPFPYLAGYIAAMTLQALIFTIGHEKRIRKGGSILSYVTMTYLSSVILLLPIIMSPLTASIGIPQILSLAVGLAGSTIYHASANKKELEESEDGGDSSRGDYNDPKGGRTIFDDHDEDGPIYPAYPDRGGIITGIKSGWMSLFPRTPGPLYDLLIAPLGTEGLWTDWLPIVASYGVEVLAPGFGISFLILFRGLTGLFFVTRHKEGSRLVPGIVSILNTVLTVLYFHFFPLADSAQKLWIPYFAGAVTHSLANWVDIYLAPFRSSQASPRLDVTEELSRLAGDGEIHKASYAKTGKITGPVLSYIAAVLTASGSANALNGRKISRNEALAYLASLFPKSKISREAADVLMEAGTRVADPLYVTVEIQPDAEKPVSELQLAQLRQVMEKYQGESAKPGILLMVKSEAEVGAAREFLKSENIALPVLDKPILMPATGTMENRSVYDSVKAITNAGKKSLRVQWCRADEVRMLTQTEGRLVVLTILGMLSEIGVRLETISILDNAAREIEIIESQA